ncbi:MAG: VanZ family protein [marine benthic group bacterium]|nr:VanZ family protein [Gemmatimonadota bacterium]
MVERKRRKRSTVRVALPGPGRRRAHRRHGWSRLRSRRARAAIVAAILLLAVLVLTLAPVESTETAIPGTCIWCGHFALADAILNVILFVPLGLALGLRGRPAPWRAWLGLTLLAGAIEVVQIFLPGRFPTLSDVIANSTGAAIGLVIAGLWRRGIPVHARQARPLPLLAGFLAAVVCVVGTLLLRPDLPESTWFGQWTPDLGHYEHYPGQVLNVRIGSTEVPGQKLENTPAVRSYLRAGESVRAQFVAGDGPPALAPIFSIYDGMEREIFVLGARDEDLVVRVRRRASDLRLRAPQSLFEDSAPVAGDTALVAASVGRREICLDPSPESCRSISPPGRGWSLLLGAAPTNRLERLADGAWLALLFIPLGYGFRPRAGWWSGLAIGLLGLATASVLGGGMAGGDLLTTIAGAGAGLLAGDAAGRWVPRRFRLRADPPTRR